MSLNAGLAPVSNAASQSREGVIWTRAQCAVFKVGGLKAYMAIKHSHWIPGNPILEGDDGLVGILYDDERSLREEIQSKLVAEDILYEFMALSDKRELEYLFLIWVEKYRENLSTFTASLGHQMHPVPMLTVMVLGWDRHGYAYRLGLGEISLKKWMQTEKEFKNIALR